MRISDWSSDVCSSDLLVEGPFSSSCPAFPEKNGASTSSARTGGTNRGLAPRHVFRRHRIGPVGIFPEFVPGDRAVVNLVRPIGEASRPPARKSAVKGKSVSVRVDPVGRRIHNIKQTTYPLHNPN